MEKERAGESCSSQDAGDRLSVGPGLYDPVNGIVAADAAEVGIERLRTVLNLAWRSEPAAHMPRASYAADARRANGSWWGGGAALVLLCLALFVPGLWSIPPVDRDESRFAQASRQMYESGDFVVPRVQDQPRLNKPPLIYWLQSASIAVLGDAPGRWTNGNVWVFRVPSVLCAIASVLLTWRLGTRMFDPRVALLAAALLAVSPMVVWDAHQARADQLLLLTVVLTQSALWNVVRAGFGGNRGGSVRGSAAVFWIGIGLGILAKGPITPMIAALTVLGLCLSTRQWRWTRRLHILPGLAVVIAIVGPWVYLIGQRIGWHEYLTRVWDETIGRSAEAKEGHWGPPGYHLVLLVVLFWPGVLMTAAAITGAFGRALPRISAGAAGWWNRLRRGEHGRAPELFLLCWLVPAWVVFELVSTKLPHYTMPLYPAVALLTARGLVAAAGTARTGLRRANAGDSVWLIVGLGLLAGLPMAIMLTHQGIRGTSAVLAGAGCLALGVLALTPAALRLRRGRKLGATLAGAGAFVVVSGLTFGVLLPRANLWISPKVVAAIDQARSLGGAENRPFAAAGFHEDSLVFLTRGRVEKLDASQLDGWFASHPRGIAVMPAEELPRHPSLRGIDGPAPHATGYNYSVGRFVDLVVVERRP